MLEMQSVHFNGILILALIAGLINGGIQITAHYWFRPLNLHPLIYYTIGSAGCLIALSAAVWYSGGNAETIGAAWLIWTVCGVWDCAAYLRDWVSSKKRRATVGKEISKNVTHTNKRGH